MSSISTSCPVSTPVVLPISKSIVWLVGTALIALAVYYFIGVDQGAVSVFGNDMHVHEFVHDARHFLGFPLPLTLRRHPDVRTTRHGKEAHTARRRRRRSRGAARVRVRADLRRTTDRQGNRLRERP
ncbi:hypothetical protein ACRAWF_36245 [Streptomyces sp. L7]